jgi:hypothetical protein
MSFSSRKNQHIVQICTTALFHMLSAYALSWEAQQTEPRHSDTQTTKPHYMINHHIDL